MTILCYKFVLTIKLNCSSPLVLAYCGTQIFQYACNLIHIGMYLIVGGVHTAYSLLSLLKCCKRMAIVAAFFSLISSKFNDIMCLFVCMHNFRCLFSPQRTSHGQIEMLLNFNILQTSKWKGTQAHRHTHQIPAYLFQR